MCWRREERGGKITKLPVCAANGRMAKSTDPATWAAFEEAVAAVGRWRCDGVGFVFGPDRAFTGLDLDHVISDGALDPAYRWVVEEAGTYTEVSPSGDGLHLIFRGAKPDWAQRSRKGQPGGRVVEMYDHDRYFTVTGDVFEGRASLASNPDVVERAYRTWIEPERAAAPPTLSAAATRGPDASMDDEALLGRMYASRRATRIRALTAGATAQRRAAIARRRTGAVPAPRVLVRSDAARMDRIFRRSGLMRDKWDSRRGGTTYGAQTIERAIEGCSEFNRPRERRADRPSRPVRPSRVNDKNMCSTAAPDTDEGGPPTRRRRTSRRRRLWRGGSSTLAGGCGCADATGSFRAR